MNEPNEQHAKRTPDLSETFSNMHNEAESSLLSVSWPKVRREEKFVNPHFISSARLLRKNGSILMQPT